MRFIALVLLIAILLAIFLKRKSDRYLLAKIVMFLLLASAIVNVSLYHNYNRSLVPGLYDGIGISNIIAYQFFPDHSWSSEFFKRRFDQSILVSIILVITLTGTFLWSCLTPLKGKR